MPKTKVINGTTKPFSLKEGTAGIFTLLKKLQPNDYYMIVVDTNATYREYWCAVNAEDPDGGVVLSSDDCEELKEVTIIEDMIGVITSYSYRGVKRESGEETTEEAKSLEETPNSESKTTEGDADIPESVVVAPDREVETTKHRGPLTWLLGLVRKPEKGSSSKSQTGNSSYSSMA